MKEQVNIASIMCAPVTQWMGSAMAKELFQFLAALFTLRLECRWSPSILGWGSIEESLLLWRGAIQNFRPRVSHCVCRQTSDFTQTIQAIARRKEARAH